MTARITMGGSYRIVLQTLVTLTPSEMMRELREAVGKKLEGKSFAEPCGSTRASSPYQAAMKFWICSVENGACS